jgi:phosphoribosylglycinamide formyltransferase 1
VIGVLVSGEGSNLQALIDEGLPVVAVAASKLGVRALERAREAGLSCAPFPLEEYGTRDERDTAMADWLAARGVSLVVCAGYMQLLTVSFLQRFPNRIVNVHGALLPQFPGTRPVRDALAAGVAETGATVHLVDEGVDTGPVLAQERVPVYPDDTYETLRGRVQALEHRLLPATVRRLCGL